MAFRNPKKQPEFADLKGILAQTKEQTENPLYQTVQVLIDRLSQFGIVIRDKFKDLDSADALNANFAPKSSTYITGSDESSTLPNSLQLLAGTNVTFDTTNPNQLIISSGGYAPMSTGAEPLEIMSDGAGSVLMVGFSE